MTTENNHKTESVAGKWDEFFKEPGEATKGTLVNLVKDVVSLYTNGADGAVELLSSKNTILIKYDQAHKSVSVRIQQKSSEETSSAYENFRFSWNENPDDSFVAYMRENEDRGSLILDGELLKRFSPNSVGIELNPIQIFALGKKLWDAHKVTERWVGMDHFYGG